MKNLAQNKYLVSTTFLFLFVENKKALNYPNQITILYIQFADQQ